MLVISKTICEIKTLRSEDAQSAHADSVSQCLPHISRCLASLKSHNSCILLLRQLCCHDLAKVSSWEPVICRDILVRQLSESHLFFFPTGPNKPTEIEQLMRYLRGSFTRNWNHFFAPATTTEIVASPFFATICGWSRKIAHRRSTARALLGQAERDTISKLKERAGAGDCGTRLSLYSGVHGHWERSDRSFPMNFPV